MAQAKPDSAFLGVAHLPASKEYQQQHKTAVSGFVSALRGIQRGVMNAQSMAVLTLAPAYWAGKKDVASLWTTGTRMTREEQAVILCDVLGIAELTADSEADKPVYAKFTMPGFGEITAQDRALALRSLQPIRHQIQRICLKGDSGSIGLSPTGKYLVVRKDVCEHPDTLKELTEEEKQGTRIVNGERMSERNVRSISHVVMEQNARAALKIEKRSGQGQSGSQIVSNSAAALLKQAKKWNDADKPAKIPTDADSALAHVFVEYWLKRCNIDREQFLDPECRLFETFVSGTAWVQLELILREYQVSYAPKGSNEDTASKTIAARYAKIVEYYEEAVAVSKEKEKQRRQAEKELRESEAAKAAERAAKEETVAEPAAKSSKARSRRRAA